MFASIANASQNSYITVTGSGKSFEEAKENAFRKAIEFKVGVTVLSDLEVKNYKVAKENIFLYSAGYVDDYKILTQENTNTGVIVMMNVSVSESKLKNRIIAEPKTSIEFDGSKHAVQFKTFSQEKTQGDIILNKTLSGYPVKAYNIKQLPHFITVDYYRNAIINIPYEISWNFEFIKSLRETLLLIEDGSNGFIKPSPGIVTIMAKDPKDWVIGSKTEHKFNDLIRAEKVRGTFMNSTPIVLVQFIDVHSNRLQAVCYTPRFISGYGESFYNTGSYNFATVYGNAKEKHTIKVATPLELIDKTNKIELSIVAENVCQN